MEDNYEMTMDQADRTMAAAANEAEALEVVQGPSIYLWDYQADANGDGAPTFLTIADSEDHAREAIIAHPEVGQLMGSEEYARLVLGPPTRVVRPERGVVFVLNWRAEDRIEA